MDSHVNVAIVGGGPVGLSLALALKDSGLKVRLLEGRVSITDGFEERSLAISHGSKLFFERFGAWPDEEAVTPIKAIHVSHRGGFGSAVLSSEEAKVPYLGYVVSYGSLLKKMSQALKTSKVEFTTSAKMVANQSTRQYAAIEFETCGEKRLITADLLAIADGGYSREESSDFRGRDYDQQAVLAYVETELPHENTAYERFTPEGPVALLPNGAGFSLVWVGNPDHARELLGLNESEFLTQLHLHFGDRLGSFNAVKNRKLVPLALKYSEKVSRQRSVMLGNAAQLLHPVAGQGLNLGIRDVADLAREILGSQKEIGLVTMLKAYEKRRTSDRMGSIFFTDFLVNLYSNDIPPLRFARGIGLASLNCLPFAKRFLMRRMMFGAA